MSENEFVLTLLVMIFGATVVILGLLIWNQDKQINRLEEMIEMLSDDLKRKRMKAVIRMAVAWMIILWAAAGMIFLEGALETIEGWRMMREWSLRHILRSH